MNSTAQPQQEQPRIALLTTGLRPVPLAFADFPGTPVGIIVWDHPAAFSSQFSEILRVIRSRISSRPFASLRDLCEKQKLKYAECDKQHPEALTALLEQWEIDLVVTSGCAIVSVDALSPARFGAINLHPSRLPDWRGANPLFWQLANSEPLLGATVHVLSERIDGGDIIAQAEVNKPVGMSRAELTQLLEGQIGVTLLKESIERIAGGQLQSVRQNSSDTPYARTVSDEKLAEAIPLDSLQPETLWDLLNFYGYAPQQWIGISRWRQRLKWVATDWYSTEQIADAPANSAGWMLVEHNTHITLKHKNGQIVLKPALFNSWRKPIVIQQPAMVKSRHVSR